MLACHTHCQAFQANAQIQTWQRVCLFQCTDRKINNEGTTSAQKQAGGKC